MVEQRAARDPSIRDSDIAPSLPEAGPGLQVDGGRRSHGRWECWRFGRPDSDSEPAWPGARGRGVMKLVTGGSSRLNLKGVQAVCRPDSDSEPA